MKCENCHKEITHTKGKFILTNGTTILKLDVCSASCGEAIRSKLY